MGDLFGGDEYRQQAEGDTHALLSLTELLERDAEEKRRAAEEAKARALLAANPERTVGQGIGTALMGIAPLLAGALLDGKEGVGYGAQAGLLGVGSLDKEIDKSQKEAAAQALFDYQESDEEADVANTFYRNAQYQGANAQQELAADLLTADSRPNAYNTEYEGESLAVQNLKARRQGLALDETREGRLSDIQAAKQATLALPYIGFVGRAASDKDITAIKKLETDVNQLNSLQAELYDSLKKKGRQLEGDDAGEQKLLASRVIDKYKEMRGYGANFTVFEKELTEAGTGSYLSFIDAMYKDGVLNQNLPAQIQKSMQVNDRQKLVALSAMGAFHKNMPYAGLSAQDKKSIRQNGINWDERTGTVLNSDDNDVFVQSALSTAGLQMNSPRVTSGNEMAAEQKQSAPFQSGQETMYKGKRARIIGVNPQTGKQQIQLLE